MCCQLSQKDSTGASFNMDNPQSTSTPGDGSPLLGDNRGESGEGERLGPDHISEVGTPVTLAPPAPPGWGDPPILPGSGTRSFPIGGLENVSKVFSHGSGAGLLRGPPPKIPGFPLGFDNGF